MVLGWVGWWKGSSVVVGERLLGVGRVLGRMMRGLGLKGPVGFPGPQSRHQGNVFRDAEIESRACSHDGGKDGVFGIIAVCACQGYQHETLTDLRQLPLFAASNCYYGRNP